MDFVLNKEFDLILLDVMFLGKDGFKVCEEIRKSKEIFILMVIVKKEDIYKIKGLGIGVDDYIVKLFSFGELVVRVNVYILRYECFIIIDKSNDNDYNLIKIGRLKILIKVRCVYIDDEEIKLVNKEFELLLFLCLNFNIVFLKDKLLDRIWGIEFFGDILIVIVYINRIREKIEIDSSNF